jgi:hypothetical protein
VNLISPSGVFTRTVSCPQIKIFVENYWFHMPDYNDTAKYQGKKIFLKIYFSWKLFFKKKKNFLAKKQDLPSKITSSNSTSMIYLVRWKIRRSLKWKRERAHLKMPK